MVIAIASIPPETDEVGTETNAHFTVLLPFAIFKFRGLLLVVVFSLLGVLMHPDFGPVTPNCFFGKKLTAILTVVIVIG